MNRDQLRDFLWQVGLPLKEKAKVCSPNEVGHEVYPLRDGFKLPRDSSDKNYQEGFLLESVMITF